MKKLFLDIDGVLNHQDFYDSVYKDCDGNIDVSKMREWRDNNPYPLSEFDPIAVARVNETLKATGAELVVSSSWRVGCSDGELENIFRKVGLPDKFDVTPILCLRVKTIEGREPCRGDEIKAYLDTQDNIESYVILDDDDDMLPEQANNFIHCDFMHGFTENDKENAIKILNS